MSSKETEEVWNEFFPKVFGYFYRRLNCREDVEDLTSVVMTKFITSLSEHKIKNQRAYLWRIAHNQLVSFYRDKTKTPVQVSLFEDDSFDWLDLKVEETHSDAYKNRVKLLVQCAKKNLKSDEYILISEIVMDDKKSTDVAKAQNLKPATVRKRLSRTLDKLRQRCQSIWDSYQHKTNNNTNYAQ